MSSPQPARRAGQFDLVLLALAAFAGFAAVFMAAPKLYLFFERIPDGIRRATPFEDLAAILAAGPCWRAGVDVYVPNACMGGGVFNYSPLMLWAGYLPIGPADRLAGGVLLAAGFFASLALLPRPAKGAEFFLLLAGVLSPSVFYALEQGNLDVLLFALTLLGLCLLQRADGSRYFAYLLFALMAAVKFYPVALLALILRERPRLVGLAACLGLAAALLYLRCFGPEFFTALRILPSSMPFHATFGAIDIARGLALLHVAGFGARHGAAAVTFACWAMSGAAVLAMLARAGWGERVLQALRGRKKLFLLAGALVIVLCFFAAQNVYYRAIFLLLTLPGLWQLAMGKGRYPKLLLAAVLALLWEAAFRDSLDAAAVAFAGRSLSRTLQTGIWLFRECLWWWVAVELGAIGLAFVTTELRRLAREGLDMGRGKIDGITINH